MRSDEVNDTLRKGLRVALEQVSELAPQHLLHVRYQPVFSAAEAVERRAN